MVAEKVAVLGSHGMLGNAVVRRLAARGNEIISLQRPDFDITSEADLKAATSASVIVNCAAYTNVDGAETNRDQAYAVNAEAVGSLGRLAAASGAYVVHMSTDFVFDGAKDGPYSETDATNPINVYGASKLRGEALLAESGCRHCILRIEWTYGATGMHFISKIRKAATERSTIRVVSDQIGTPTWTGDVADTIATVIDERLGGTYHFAAAGYASRFETAAFIVDFLEIHATVAPCRSSDFVTAARRPLNSRFDCSALDGALSMKRANWTQSLETYLLSV